MRKAVGWWVWFGMVSISAGEIMAWKVPVSRYSEHPNGRKRLEKPPEDSLFFQPGDELWTVEKSADKLSPEVEWAVWNETNGTLVVKCGTETIPPLYQFLGMDQVPLHGRVKLEILETRADGSAEPDTPPVHSLEITGKPQLKLTADSEADGRKIEVEAEFRIDESGKKIDLNLDGTFLLPDQPALNLKTELSLESGAPLQIAEDNSGSKGMAIRVTATPVTTDGTPLGNQIRIQRDGVPIPLEFPRKQFRKHRMSENLWLCIAPTDLDALVPDASVSYAPPEDALPELGLPSPGLSAGSATDHNNDKTPESETLKTIKVPESIAGWFGGPVLDLRKTLRNHGVSGEQDFAGYDVRGNALVLLTSSETEADQLEQLLSSLGGMSHTVISVSCESTGKSRILTRAGSSATLKRGADETKPARCLEVNPFISNEGFVGMRLHFSDRPSEGSSASLLTSLELEEGRALEVHVTGMKKPLQVRADIIGR